jgi:hypothetical protein
VDAPAAIESCRLEQPDVLMVMRALHQLVGVLQRDLGLAFGRCLVVEELFVDLCDV